VKKNILYFSDSTFFSGSQNMIINFLESKSLNKEFNVLFAYNYSKLYQKGLDERLSSKSLRLYPINLAKKFLIRPGKKNLFYKIYLGLRLLFNKYYSLILNTYLLFNFLKNKNIEIIHINNGGFPGTSSCNAMVLASKLRGINKIIYVINNTAEGYSFFLRWFDCFVDRLIIKCVTKFVTGSNNSLQIFKKKINVPQNKLVQIFNGIKPRKTKISIKSFLNSHLISKYSKKISVVGNLEERKGHIFLLKALKKILDEKFEPSPILLIAIGKINPELNNLKSYIKKNNLDKNVIFLPYEINIYDLYSITDILITPSIGFEDLPNVISEAMSVGVPVIGTSIAGIPEQIINDKTGYIVKPEDYLSLAICIKKILSDKDKSSKLSLNSKLIFKKKFHYKSSVDKYLNLYKSLK